MVETGKISVTDYVRVTSTECAKIFNMYPRKGAILEGSDADIIIILNPERSFVMGAHTHHSRSNTNVYLGRKGKGMVEVTISRGRVVWEDGVLNIAPGSGTYVRMPPFGYIFDGIEKSQMPPTELPSELLYSVVKLLLNDALLHLVRDCCLTMPCSI
ncbi:hypothetical protein GQ55_5G113200 [Panicum hallii var. hallii]|uniref:dihydropyrimidinase n=1 Tax=Panicum hallii var. hallii TaxID=1504633 RepID=A0A2T7DF66_9POAL|nr:hypothetical protein GQ55_5G113200 [Panicum hallii var. hallii]